MINKDVIEWIICGVYNILIIILTCYMSVNYSYWWLLLLLFSADTSEGKRNN
jgi:hypothetical protein